MRSASRAFSLVVLALSVGVLFMIPALRQQRPQVTNTSQGEDEAPRPDRSPSEPTPSPTAAPPDEKGPEERPAPLPRKMRLAAKVLGACLRDEIRHPDLLFTQSATAMIGRAGGGPVKDVAKLQSPVRFSPSGRYVLGGDGQLIDTRGAPEVTLFKRPRTVTWFPLADCALGTTQRGLELGRPGRDPIILLNRRRAGGSIVDVSVSDSGRNAAFVLATARRRSVWIADLTRGRARRSSARPSRRDEITLGPWLRKGPSVITQTRSGSQLAVLTTKGKPLRFGPKPPQILPGSLQMCGDRSLTGILEPTDGAGTIASFSPRATPKRITPEGHRYSAFSCSPDGSYLVAVSAEEPEGRLHLLDRDGDFVTDLTRDDGLMDFAPLWGEPGEGLVFVRSRDGMSGTIWHLPEGSTARSLDLPVASSGSIWMFDWAAR